MAFFHLLLLFLIINVSSLGDVNIWKYTDEATEPSQVFARSMIKGAWRDCDWAPVYRARDGRHGKLSSNILDKSGVMAEWKSLVSDMFTYFLILFPNIFSSTRVNLFCPVTIHCFYWPKEKNQLITTFTRKAWNRIFQQFISLSFSSKSTGKNNHLLTFTVLAHTLNPLTCFSKWPVQL